MSILLQIFYLIGKMLFKDNTKNLLALAAGTANTGYFGVPVAIELFGEGIIGILVVAIFGFTVFENSLIQKPVIQRLLSIENKKQT